MKKFTLRLISVLLCVATSVAVLCSCSWITVNVDRDMAQVIAEVNISDNNEIDTEKIYKRDLNIAYASYGYQYVTQSGYSTSAAYQKLLDSLVKNKVIIQQARIELAKIYNDLIDKTTDLTDLEKSFLNNALANKKAIDAKSGEINDPTVIEKSVSENKAPSYKGGELYLSEYEYYTALYNTKKSINDFIKTYVDRDNSSSSTETENETHTARTAPTVEDRTFENEKEMQTEAPTSDEYKIALVTLGGTIETIKAKYTNVYDLNLATYKAYKIDITSDNSRKKAFSAGLKFLMDNGFIDSKEEYDFSSSSTNVVNYTYFKSILKSNIEGILVSKYEEFLNAKVEKRLSGEGVWDEYVREYNSQKARYSNSIDTYESALEAASDTSFVLYNPYEGYGYVANILVGFSSTQSSLLTEYAAKNSKTDTKAYRDTLLNSLVANDQRSSWVYASNGKYSVDSLQKGVFTFDEDHLKTENELFKNFIGEVNVKNADGITEKDDNGVDKTTWAFNSVTPEKIPFNTFFSKYVEPFGMTFSGHCFEDGNASTVGKIADYTEESYKNLEEIMYAFSTDPGCLGSTYGYLYSPNGTDFVKEFENASKAVVEKAKTEGIGTYTVVATDFGYHIIVCTKLVSDPYEVPTEKEKFLADIAVEDTVAKKYKTAILNTITNDEVSKEANKFINDYLGDEAKVKYYKNAYSDLITEATSASVK